MLYPKDLSTTNPNRYTVESAIDVCFLLNQEISEFPKNWQVPLVLFLSILLLAKLASEYPINSKKDPFGY